MQDRLESAKLLNGIPQDELFYSWGITRVGAIDGLDTIGVPVWSACRPMSPIISVTAGKSRVKELARAGAIAEAIEYHTFEQPPKEWYMFGWADYSGLPVSSNFKEHKRIPICPVIHYANQQMAFAPAHLMCLSTLGHPEIADCFQRNSNGNAIGPNFESALIAGIYECVERDAVTIRRHLRSCTAIHPCTQVLDLVEKVKATGAKLYLFDFTYDIPIPVMVATIIEPGGVPYSGWGCSVDPVAAQEKAVLEAIQSRSVYVAGARDDIHKDEFKELEKRDIEEELSRTVPVQFGEMVKIHDELSQVIEKLGIWAEQLYYRRIDLPYGLVAVKSFIRGLEQPMFRPWKSVGRCQ